MRHSLPVLSLQRPCRRVARIVEIMQDRSWGALSLRDLKTLIRDTHTPGDLIDELVRHLVQTRRYTDAMTFASHPNTPADTLVFLAQTFSPDNLSSLATSLAITLTRHPNATPELFDVLIANNNMDVSYDRKLRYIARHPKVTVAQKSLIEALVTEAPADYHHLWALARSGLKIAHNKLLRVHLYFVTDEMWRAVLKDADEQVRRAMARCPKMPADILEQLAQYPHCRQLLLQNTALPDELRTYLMLSA